MARLIYGALASLDGFVADEHGRFDWAEPDDEVHAFVNDLERSVGTYLYGRRMYEVMVGWETLDLADEPPHIRDYAEVWLATRTRSCTRGRCRRSSSERTQLEREFDPDAVQQLKASADRDLAIGGPGSPPTPSRPGWSTSAPAPGAARGGGRDAGVPRRRPDAARAVGRAPVRQRNRPRPLSRRLVTSGPRTVTANGVELCVQTFGSPASLRSC